MDCSTPGLPVHHQLPELAQTHVHWVGDAIQPSHPPLSPSPALNLSQHPMSQLFASGGQSIGASASVHPENTQDWFLLPALPQTLQPVSPSFFNPSRTLQLPPEVSAAALPCSPCPRLLSFWNTMHPFCEDPTPIPRPLQTGQPPPRQLSRYRRLALSDSASDDLTHVLHWGSSSLLTFPPQSLVCPVLCSSPSTWDGICWPDE